MADKKIHKTGYISDLDKFFRDYDKSHPDFCTTRQNEIKKFAKIFNLRDNVQQAEAENPIFKDF